MVVRYRLPYREPESLDAHARAHWRDIGRAAEFSHSLEAQIGGQVAAGFVLTDPYEDTWSDDATPLNAYCPVAIATRAVEFERPMPCTCQSSQAMRHPAPSLRL